jgi:hypothetical protein
VQENMMNTNETMPAKHKSANAGSTNQGEAPGKPFEVD